MADNEGRFPDPHEFEVPPELEGWEEMYPSHHLFSEDRAAWEKAQFCIRIKSTPRNPYLLWITFSRKRGKFLYHSTQPGCSVSRQPRESLSE